MSSTAGPVTLEAALPVVDEVVRFVCRRARCDADEQDEFAASVRLKLVEGDGEVLRRFEGRSELRTYLGVVVQRLFIDFRRQRWGMWRPSAEARRTGHAAIVLDQLLNRDGLGLDEALAAARMDARVTESAEELRGIAERLPRRPRRRTVSEEVLFEVPVAPNAEVAILEEERGRRAVEVRHALEELVATLEPQDAAILRLRFEGGLTVARIAVLLGIEQKPLYRRIERLLGRLREALEDRGFAALEVSSLVGAGAFEDGS
jgi:RNA polymerase sigma factor (sigma-70 family)